MEHTKKDFIGKFQESRFAIFDSFFPTGVACIIEAQGGHQSHLQFTARLHHGFLILYFVWLTIVTLSTIILGIMNSTPFGLAIELVMLAVAALAFRMMFHWLYVFSRNRALRKLEILFEWRLSKI